MINITNKIINAYAGAIIELLYGKCDHTTTENIKETLERLAAVWRVQNNYRENSVGLMLDSAAEIALYYWDDGEILNADCVDFLNTMKQLEQI